MFKPYDMEEDARLVSEYDKLESKRQDFAKQMHDMANSDEASDISKLTETRIKHDWFDAEAKRVKDSLDKLRVTKPMRKDPRKNPTHDNALYRWITKGDNGLEGHEIEDQKAAREGYGSPTQGVRSFVDDIFYRAIATPDSAKGNADNEGGQNLTDETTVQGIIEGLADFGGAVEACTIAMTPDGNKITYPTYWDGASDGGTPKKGVQLASMTTESQGQDLSAFQERELDSYVFDSNFIQLSRFFNEDVRWDVGAFVRRVLMRRVGRVVENLVANGDGSSKPAGFLTRAQTTDTRANTAGLDWRDLVDLIHSIDPAYIRGEIGLYGFNHRPGKTGFMTSWKFLGKLKTLQDGENRPLVLPSLQSNGTDVLFGYPIYICQEFPDQDEFSAGAGGAGKAPIAFGNWGAHTVRFAGRGLMIEEHYDSGTAKSNHNLYLGKVRLDSEAIAYCPTTGTNANKCPAYKKLTRKT